MDLAGNQLLAGARLAQDQHAGAGGGHQLDLLHHVDQGGTAADDLAEEMCPADLLAEIIPLQLEPFVAPPDLLERPDPHGLRHGVAQRRRRAVVLGGQFHGK